MNTKKDLYFKLFVRYFLISEILIIATFFLYILAPFFDGDYSFAFIFYFCLNILVFICIFLIYIRNPNLENLPAKEDASENAKIHIFAIILFFIASIFVNDVVLILKEYISLPFTGFYGDIMIIAGVIWIIVFRKDFIQLFDIAVIYLKDQLYPETWPALKRQNDREVRFARAYESWLVRNGSSQEKNYYKELSKQSPDEGRKFAHSRMKQIENESNE